VSELSIQRTLPPSRPTRARGLKLLILLPARPNTSSRPTRARGLKLATSRRAKPSQVSRPTRARGLKHKGHIIDPNPVMVAPHAGAWIETSRVYLIFPSL